jgi:hypothetical protein
MDYTLAEYIPETFDLLAYDGALDKLVNTMGYPRECSEFQCVCAGGPRGRVGGDAGMRAANGGTHALLAHRACQGAQARRGRHSAQPFTVPLSRRFHIRRHAHSLWGWGPRVRQVMHARANAHTTKYIPPSSALSQHLHMRTLPNHSVFTCSHIFTRPRIRTWNLPRKGHFTPTRTRWERMPLHSHTGDCVVVCARAHAAPKPGLRNSLARVPWFRNSLSPRRSPEIAVQSISLSQLRPFKFSRALVI